MRKAEANKALAAKLRNYAAQMEKNGAVQPFEYPEYVEEFTCNLVKMAIREATGTPEMEARARRAKYARAFGFDTGSDDGENDSELWNTETRERTKLRATLLGFAAAMVETGDL